MNDEQLEHHLRQLPAPELPPSWHAEIMATALREVLREARPAARPTWPPLLIVLRNLFARNPFTTGALTVLWLLIFLFKTTTPVDPAEKAMIAQYDPNAPIHLVTLNDEIRLAELLQEPPEPRRLP
jgi:hypothetical protein